MSLYEYYDNKGIKTFITCKDNFEACKKVAQKQGFAMRKILSV